MSVQLLLRQRLALRKLPSCSRVSATCFYSAQAAQVLQSQDVQPQAGPSSSPQESAKDEPAEHTSQEVRPSAKVTSKKSTPKRERVPRRNHLEPYTLQKDLSQIEGIDPRPTAEDLARFRPQSHATPGTKAYEEQYKALIQTLCNSFSKSQLKGFYENGLRVKRLKIDRKKPDFAKAIIEGDWQWPSLEDIKKAEREKTEVVTKAISVNQSELFLILGSDGVNLSQLSHKHKVHVSLKQDPLALLVCGVRAAFTSFAEDIKAIKKEIVLEQFHLPTRSPIPSELRQRVSRRAGAYLSNLGDNGAVKICARDQQSLARAKRFASRAVSEAAMIGHSPVVSLICNQASDNNKKPKPISTSTYSLYPFASPRALPWYMSHNGIFRVRRVSEWLHTPSPDYLRAHAGLTNLSPIIRNNDQTTVPFQDLLSHLVPEVDHDLTVQARLGHILFTTTTPDQRSTFAPPLGGQHEYGEILKWLSKQQHPTFVSSLPASLIDIAPSEQKVVHRLVYVSTHTSSPSSGSSTSNPLAQSQYVSAEIVLALSKEHAPSSEPPSEQSDEDVPLEQSEDSKNVSQTLPLQATFKKGTEAFVDVMMPDRPMDMRLVISKTQEITNVKLRDYATLLHQYLQNPTSGVTQPDPPLVINHDGINYNLHSNYTVRQSVDQGPPSYSLTADNAIVSESIADLDSEERSTLCQVVCSDPTSEKSWNNFLGACDYISTTPYQSRSGHFSSTTESADDTVLL